MNWKSYFTKQKGRKPRPQLVEAIKFCENKNRALDLGCGNFIESNYLAKKGFHSVVAIDSAYGLKQLSRQARVLFICQPFNEVEWVENYFDLINAQYSLPFYGKKDFTRFIKEIKSSLNNTGIFTGQFFGINDSWNLPESNMVFHTKEEIGKLLFPLEIIELKEEEYDGETALGKKKHWHVFHFIVKK